MGSWIEILSNVVKFTTLLSMSILRTILNNSVWYAVSIMGRSYHTWPTQCLLKRKHHTVVEEDWLIQSSTWCGTRSYCCFGFNKKVGATCNMEVGISKIQVPILNAFQIDLRYLEYRLPSVTYNLVAVQWSELPSLLANRSRLYCTVGVVQYNRERFDREQFDSEHFLQNVQQSAFKMWKIIMWFFTFWMHSVERFAKWYQLWALLLQYYWRRSAQSWYHGMDDGWCYALR